MHVYRCGWRRGAAGFRGVPPTRPAHDSSSPAQRKVRKRLAGSDFLASVSGTAASKFPLYMIYFSCHLIIVCFRVLARRVFLTEEPYTWWADLVWWLTRVEPGRIVLLAGGGRASLGFRHARKLLAHLGSIFVPSLGHDTSWSWAFVKGGRTLFESIVRGRHQRKVSLGL